MIGLLTHCGAIEIPSDDSEVRVFEIPLTNEGCEATAAHGKIQFLEQVALHRRFRTIGELDKATVGLERGKRRGKDLGLRLPRHRQQA